MIPNELAWFLCPLFSFLRIADGTWGNFRWVTVGLMILSSILFKRFKWTVIPITIGLAMLPITLGGDSVTAHWYNWLWVWVLGYLNGLWIIPLVRNISKGFLLALIPMVIYGICITLSNIPLTADIFQWKLCEGLMGFSLGIPFAYMVCNDE